MRRLVPLAALAVLAGCTTTVAGQGQGSAPPTSAAPTPTSSSAPAPPSIGDPNTADLCAGIQLSAYKVFGQPSFDPSQTPPGCYVTIAKSGLPIIGLSVVAMPLSQAIPRAQGHPTTVAGLPVVDFTPDPSQCQRDVWLQETVLSVRADDLGAKVTGPLLCRVADQLVAQTAKSVGAGDLPRVKLASPSLTRVQMCRAIQPGDLRGVSRGAPVEVAPHYYGTFCRASNPLYVFGVEMVFRKVAAKPLRTTAAGGHRFAWFDQISPDSIACDLTSMQRPTSDPTTVEAVDLYLLARAGPLRGQPLCQALTGLAVTALSRLGLR